jgi:hypothetical protein
MIGSLSCEASEDIPRILLGSVAAGHVLIYRETVSVSGRALPSGVCYLDSVPNAISFVAFWNETRRRAGPPYYEFILMSLMRIVELELRVFISGSKVHSSMLFYLFII